MIQVVLPEFCEVVEVDEPYPWGRFVIRWTFACHRDRCEGKDMSREGVGWIVAQAITAAELHARIVHQWHESQQDTLF